MKEISSSQSLSSGNSAEIPDGFVKRRSGLHPIKSYDNSKWMHGRSARHVRILCEYLEVQDRLGNAQVLFTLLVFGSARSFSRANWEIEMKKSMAEQEEANAANDTARIEELEQKLKRLRRIEKLCEYWDKTYVLCKMLMTWFQTLEARKALSRILREVPSPTGSTLARYFNVDVKSVENVAMPSQVALCTGGGKGLMEAANKGAHDVEGARSMGMGVSLPFEPELNTYVDPDLAFEFHYFFTRKFWMAYTAVAIIAVPGGFGTLDELMELLTLKQTGKLKRDIPIVLFGETFWKQVINFDAMVEYGTISERDRNQLFFTDEPLDAFNYIKEHILSDKLILGDTHVHKSIRNSQTSNATKTIQPF
ncbi:lysine decarboxylase family protein [Cardiosporidium cionae]|uniref:Lysine decarboxylase family protein n=1 Tax=Cardiosporidium cionae TaxID=476202 RepID=A0ABQ7JFS8_9APIC|nr:lysine decarboxylase family protein [Cardiosporidium cionae]|eukprot:KAF8822505.1 lysine decarboxylase family protein [Cardiosporidium cionae]